MVKVVTLRSLVSRVLMVLIACGTKAEVVKIAPIIPKTFIYNVLKDQLLVFNATPGKANYKPDKMKFMG